ncbi:MAG: hypothetical protein ACP5ID_05860 [Conexivisphaera sp.]
MLVRLGGVNGGPAVEVSEEGAHPRDSTCWRPTTGRRRWRT